MAEIILPPEEETPQAPELNIDKPTENSKVITIEFEAKKTNKVSTKDTNQQLYTTDTDAWFEFKETSLEGANGTYSVVFRNRHDGSIFQRTGDVVNGVAYYKIPHQEIRHAGAWRGQIVYTLSNGDTTSREFDYDVKGHILDGKDVREIVVEDFETLMSQLRSMKDNAEVELANLVNTANQNETDRQAFFVDLVEDIDGLQANYQELLDTGVLQTNINTKLEALEEEYAPKLTEVTAQLAQTNRAQARDIVNKLSAKQLSLAKKREPLVLFTDDDGSTEIIPKLKPISEETGVPFSISLIAGSMDKGLGITASQAKDLQDNLGWEILSHGYDDSIDYLGSDGTTLEDVEEDLVKSAIYLRERGLDVKSFCYPGGRNNSEIRRLVSKYYNSALGTKTQPIAYPFRTFEINRLAYPQPAPNNTFAFYKSKVDEAVSNNQMLVWMLHAGQSTLDANQLQILRDLIIYIKSINVDMVTLQEALDRVGMITEINDGQFYMNPDGSNNMINTIFKNVDLSAQDLIPISTPPNQFERFKTTISLVSSDRGNAPNGQGGILVTNSMGPSSLPSQIFHASNGLIFQRTASSQTVWNKFSQVVTSSGRLTHRIKLTVPANGVAVTTIPLESYNSNLIGHVTPAGTIPNTLLFNAFTNGSGGVIAIRFHNMASEPVVIDSDWYYTIQSMVII